MEKNEAILIIGAERYSDYQGYGSTFCWKYRQRDVSLQRLVYCEPRGGSGYPKTDTWVFLDQKHSQRNFRKPDSAFFPTRPIHVAFFRPIPSIYRRIITIIHPLFSPLLLLFFPLKKIKKRF